MTLCVQEALLQAQAQGLPRLEAEMLLLHALSQSSHARAWLLTHELQVLDQTQIEQFQKFTQRRLKLEPMAYILGYKEFFGLTLHINNQVLDPRPDTETLVIWALDTLDTALSTKLKTPRAVMDLGTGSGAVALAIQHARPDVDVQALDCSAAALELAQLNAQQLDLSVKFRQGYWLDGVLDTFDLIVSNPPYIPLGDAHLTSLRYEPTLALISGADGLHAIKQIVSSAAACLKPGGWLLLEHGFDQAPTTRHLLAEAGFEYVQSRKDLAGIERCSGGQKAQPKSTQ
jgi:release factor glutamine methyltransferase